MIYLFLHTKSFTTRKITITDETDSDIDIIVNDILSRGFKDEYIRIEVLEKNDTQSGDKPFVWKLIRRIL